MSAATNTAPDLRAAAQIAMEVLHDMRESFVGSVEGGAADELMQAAEQSINDLRAALAQQQPAASGAQPVAWQGGMSNAELRAAWGRKLPGVEPSDAELTAFALGVEVGAAPAAAQPPKPLTDEQIEAGREATFSTDNPYCPCSSKTMRKAVRWAERAHGIGAAAPAGEQSHG